jgi:hydroxymethylpyrimidine pyrophosphatase-like HAD family hydrolase
VHLPAEQRDIYDVRLPEPFVDALYAICDAERCVATVTIEQDVLLKLDGTPDPSTLPKGLTPVAKLGTRRDSLPRVAAIQGSKANQRIRDELQGKFAETVNFFDSIGPNGKTILTLTHRNADKGLALRVALDHLGLRPEDTVAFGDAENDLQMFRIAGASVAMGQADESIRKQASFVTLPNTECGVAYAIDRLLARGAFA